MAQQSVHQLYRRLETIGKGAYGSVHKGVHIPSGNLVALKIINLDTPDDDVEDIQREVALLTQLRDAPNVTKYFGCYLDGPRVWIIMEYAQGGSVRDLMNVSKDNTLEEKYVVVVVREVLLGLSYLHKSSIIHRDIKAANVLITATGKVMICDFGVSALLATASSKRNTLMGTPNWMAPEVAQTVPAYDTRADIWSLGILIYEMVKGAPPHVGIDKFKVIHLIPRVAPPRLIEGEGSKDMRDFVSCCLKESPSDRLSADELMKTKWIKSASKTSVTVLKDLIIRYEAWKQGGGSRDSLAAPLPWEEDEEKDLQNLDGEDQNLWEFDTVRGRSFLNRTIANDDLADSSDDDSFHAHTIRPPVPSKFPSSLRLLFEDESASQPDSFPSTLQIPSLHNNPSVTSLSPSPTRDRGAIKRTLTGDNTTEELATAKPANFAFPPRVSTPRIKSKSPGSVPGSEDEDPRKERLSPLGPGIPMGTATMTSQDAPSGSSLSTANAKSGASYREVRSTRGVPNIEIPPPLPPDINVDRAPNTAISASPEPSGPLLSSSRPLINRKRSQSSTPGLGAGLGNQPNRGFPSHADFQFPPASSISGDKVHNRTSPTHASTSSTSPSAHQTTYSLDASVVALQPRRLPTAGTPPMPPSITRTRSATALAESAVTLSGSSGPAAELLTPSRKPSISRQTSVAVMETVQLQPTTPSPAKPFARGRDRSGSSARSDGNISTPNGLLGLPVLKDVLKIPSLSEHQLGTTDLLPPSPSAAMYNPRTYTPSPSLLGSSATQADMLPPPPALRNHPSNSSLIPPRSASPDRTNATDSSQSNSYSYFQNTSTSSSTSASTSFNGPAMRPLDFSAVLISPDATHVALAQTVEDLSQWLSIVERGLTDMLECVSEDPNTIEEEQEDADALGEPHEDDSRGASTLTTNDPVDATSIALAARA